MKGRKTIFIIAGVTALVFGIFGAIPSFLQENFLVGSISALLVIIGLILIGIAFEN